MRIRALITDETVVVGINNPRNSSKIAFCIPIGSARMRLSQRWIGGRSSSRMPSSETILSPLCQDAGDQLPPSVEYHAL